MKLIGKVESRPLQALAGAVWVMLGLGGLIRAEVLDPGIYEAKRGIDAKGYDANAVFLRLNGEDINAFNFNFVVSFSLPFGLSYPENAGTSLDLRLYYNSRVTHEEGFDCHNSKAVRVRRENPVGFGFDLSLGRVIQVHRAHNDPQHKGTGLYDHEYWAYVSPDGATHVLHDSGDGVTFYSHDGSHLRGTYDGPSLGWTVEFPDGMVHEFGHEVAGPPKDDYAFGFSCCDENTPTCNSLTVFNPDSALDPNARDRDWVGWHVTAVRSKAAVDTEPPSYTIAYQDYTELVEGSPVERFGYIPMTITDRHGRVISITIDEDPQSDDFGRVTSIEVPAPADALGAPRTATYSLSYEAAILGATATATHPVRVLRRIDGPDVGSGEHYAHEFTYTEIDEPGGGTSPPYPGVQLRTVRYPSGNLVRFAYKTYSYMIREETLMGCIDRVMNSPSWGVAQKELFLDGDEQNESSSNLRVWSFAQFQELTEEGWSTGGCPVGHADYDQLHQMIDPAGNATVMHFRTPFSQDKNRYGQLVDQRTYLGTSEMVREELYEYDLLDGVSAVADYDWVKDRTETRYHDDAPGGNPTTLIVEGSAFDTFGHAQEMIYSGSAVGDVKKVTQADYLSDNTVTPGGVLCTSASDALDNWLGDLVVRKELLEEDGSATRTSVSRTEYGVLTDRGITTAVAERIDLEPASNPCDATPVLRMGDRVTTYGYSDAGDIDSKNVSIEGVPEAGSFGWDFGWEHGTLAWQKNPALSYYDFIRAIDQGSGLVVKHEATPLQAGDPNAVVTTTEYDVLGRTTRMAEGDDEPVVITYENDPLLDGSDRLARVRRSRGTGSNTVETLEHYDQLGRLERLDRLTADGGWAYQHTEYDAAGRTHFVTEWTDDPDCSDPPGGCQAASIPGTLTDYTTDGDGNPDTGLSDAFGRPRQITASLGEVTRLEYFGTNKRVIVEGVAAPPMVGEMTEVPIDSIMEYYTDGLGRLRAVQQSYSYDTQGAMPEDLPAADAVYAYDVADRLTQVNLVSGFTWSPTATDRYATDPLVSPQQRSFTYDTLGRQTSSTHPESGTTTTLAWNALGEPTQVQDALGTARGYYHETTYDAVGRPTMVERVSTDPNFYERPIDFADWNDNKWKYQTMARCGFPYGVWYFGDSNCLYSVHSAENPKLTLENSIGPLPTGATLSFQYFREVRFDPASSNEDVFTVTIQEVTSGQPPKTEVFRVDATQLSWSRWMWSPAIPLDDFAGMNVIIEFEFKSASSNPTPNRGIAIRDIVVKKPASQVLHMLTYDQGTGVGNKFLGKLTGVDVVDESTSAVVFKKRLIYNQPEGRLSSEEIDLDWDRDGTFHSFASGYEYNSMGQLSKQVPPHLTSEIGVREHNYVYQHGALVGASASSSISSNVEDVVPNAVGSPGITYNLAGGMESLRYANGRTTHIDSNSAYLPDRIYVDDGVGGPTLFDTGAYQYDGARNIKAMGGDEYRYDHVGRLVRGKVASTDFGSGLMLRYGYDMYGNMESRQTQLPGGGITPLGPVGLHFASRAYDPDTNRIAGSFEYDANGNMIAEPDHDGVTGHRYIFTPENRIAYIQSLDDGTLYQEAQYDAGGNRWLRRSSSDGGKALLTLRDASGQVAAEYEEESATSGLQAHKAYVHGNGQLLATTSACGPAPTLTLEAVGDGYVTVHAATDSAPASFMVETDSSVDENPTVDPVGSDSYNIDTTGWSELTDYRIRVRTTIACGTTDYSNAVSLRLGGGGCVSAMGLAHAAFTAFETTVQIKGYENSCQSNWVFDLWYFPEVGLPSLLASDLATPSKDLPRTSLGAGHGRYSFAERDPETGYTVPVGGNVRNDFRNTTGEFGEPVGTATLARYEYVHADHLGSTRLVTDESGQEVSHYKFYPFGEYAETSSGTDLRMKFTGHERDEGLNLDYMFARYYSANTARFLSVDPVGGSPDSPQRWNGYAYVTNNPLRFNDPNGEDGNDVANWVDATVQTAVSYTDANTGSGLLGVALNAAVGTAGDLASGAADMLRVGAATGEAIGSGADGEGLLRAGAQDVGRASGLALSLAGVAQAANTTTVVHFTDDAGRAAITESGSLRANTYVTKPGQVPKGATAAEAESALEIGAGKGQHSVQVRTARTNLKTPDGGPKTSGGAAQKQLKTETKIDPKKFKETE